MLNPPALDREPVVIMWTGDGGIEVLAEDRTYLLPKASLRDLLFLGNRVPLLKNGEATERAFASPVPFPHWITVSLDGERHLVHRMCFVRVARGDVPVDRLRRVGGR